MNTKMTLNELKAKLDLIPNHLGNKAVILVQVKGQNEGTGKAYTVYPAEASFLDDGSIQVAPLSPNRDYREANAVVIANTY